jgi:hypothetical protein
MACFVYSFDFIEIFDRNEFSNSSFNSWKCFLDTPTNPGQTNPGQTNPGQTNPGQTNPGHDKPWTGQTLDSIV